MTPVEQDHAEASSSDLSLLLSEVFERPGGTIIEAKKAAGHYWRDLWNYRELLILLAWRDISVRYRQTFLGVIWAVIQPLAAMLMLTFAFGTVAGMSSGDIPYPILVYAGVLPWQFFSSALSNCSQSLVTNANLLTKVYFPRLLVPASSIIVCFIDFSISCVLLTLLMVYYQFSPTIYILLLPILLLLLFLATFGLGVLLATWNVRYRDFRYVVPFILQFGLFLSPVGFSTASVPEQWRLIYSINPMVGIIDGFRFALLGQKSELEPAGFAASCLLILLLLAFGIISFRRMERQFADVI